MNETFRAEVIQFHLPNGRQTHTSCPLPIDIKPFYDEMLAKGCHLEAEILSTGMVSMTVSNGESDIDITLVPNGPRVQEKLIAMLKRSSWNKQQEEVE